jgi:hypothetical protein
MNNNFIIQTAKDYDMDVSEVQRIYNQYPDNFYEKLEEFILNRSKSV